MAIKHSPKPVTKILLRPIPSSAKLAVSQHYHVAFGDETIAEGNKIWPGELQVPHR
jgi:hypothetical protein